MTFFVSHILGKNVSIIFYLKKVLVSLPGIFFNLTCSLLYVLKDKNQPTLELPWVIPWNSVYFTWSSVLFCFFYFSCMQNREASQRISSQKCFFILSQCEKTEHKMFTLKQLKISSRWNSAGTLKRAHMLESHNSKIFGSVS